MYLVNPLLIWVNLNQSPTVGHLNAMYQVQFMASIYLQTMFMAALLYVFCEAPFSALSKLIVNIYLGKTKN